MKVCRSRLRVAIHLLPRLIRRLGEALVHGQKHFLWIANEEDRVWCTLCNKTLLRRSWTLGHNLKKAQKRPGGNA